MIDRSKSLALCCSRRWRIASLLFGGILPACVWTWLFVNHDTFYGYTEGQGMSFFAFASFVIVAVEVVSLVWWLTRAEPTSEQARIAARLFSVGVAFSGLWSLVFLMLHMPRISDMPIAEHPFRCAMVLLVELSPFVCLIVYSLNAWIARGIARPPGSA